MSTLHDQRRAAIAALRAAFPLAFPADPEQVQPLAVGIFHDLLAWSQDQPDLGLTKRGLKLAVQRHCGHINYLRRVVVGAMRIDLQGRAVAPVTPEAQAHSEAILADYAAARQRKAEKLARHLAAEAKRQEAAAKPKPKAPAKPKAAKAPPPVAPQPTPAPKVAPAKAAPAVVVKKRRVVVPPVG